MDFHRKGGTLCLDLVGTLYDWRDRRVERLSTPERLAEWLEFIHLPSPAGACGAADLEAARQLREAVHAVVRAVLDGEQPTAQSIATLNAAARQPTPPPGLGADGRTRSDGPAPSMSGLLSLIARDAVDLLTGPDAGRIRECEGADCSMLFVDRSRPGHRRWCAMKGCGEKAAAAAYRRRKAGEPTFASLV
jgi:predicted RNA-binding Zn ribbon-like protein